MYFSSNSILKCYFGRLIIERTAHNSSKYTCNEKYKYCGIIPSFALYPSSNKVTVVINLIGNKVTFDTIISYSVIDSKRIISYQVKETNSVAPILVIKLISTDSYFLKYQFEVEKYERMHILCNFSQYYYNQVYDGPGTLYNVLEPLKENGTMVYYTTTTFQSVVLLLTSEFKVVYSILITYNATISTQKFKETYLQKNNSIFVTSEMELINFDIRMIKMKTEAQLFFKIKINQLKQTGIKYSSCAYAGVTLYDININGSFQKISTVYNSNEQEYKYKNMYTQNLLMLLVLYSYKSYLNISLNLSISTSECKAATINICELKKDDFILESISFFSSNKQKCIILQLDYRQENISLLEMDRDKSDFGYSIDSIFIGTNLRCKYITTLVVIIAIILVSNSFKLFHL